MFGRGVVWLALKEVRGRQIKKKIMETGNKTLYNPINIPKANPWFI